MFDIAHEDQSGFELQGLHAAIPEQAPLGVNDPLHNHDFDGIARRQGIHELGDQIPILLAVFAGEQGQSGLGGLIENDGAFAVFERVGARLRFAGWGFRPGALFRVFAIGVGAPLFAFEVTEFVVILLVWHDLCSIEWKSPLNR
jgi:hypothetical protein